MNNIEKLKKVVEDLHLDNAYGTVQVAYGCKHTKGQYTEEKCIRFGVERKLPLSEIPEERRIPSKINIDGVEYSTDVYVVPAKIYTSAAMRKLDGNYAASGGPLSLSECNPIGDNAVPPNVTAPVSVNRATTRPLRGGVSMAATPPTGYVNAGTLGVVVLDSTDNKLVALTNNHVCATQADQMILTQSFFPTIITFHQHTQPIIT